MDHYNQAWLPPVKPRKRCSLPLGAGVLVVGVVGGSLGVAALTAYAVVQAPTIRSRFGGYFTNTSSNDIDDIYKIIYTIEIAAVVLGGILGILTNALLIYGVIRSKRWFLVHWLVYHVFVVAIGLVATILILLLQSGLYKLYCLVPVAIIVSIVLSWVKVYQCFCEMDVQIKPPKCQMHRGGGRGPPPGPHPWMTGGWGGGYVSEWMMNSKENGLEFYPVDKLSRTMKDRMFDSPWREGWSVDRQMENTLYCESEDTSSSIVPERNENEYTTLPVECKLHPQTSRPDKSGQKREDYIMAIKPIKVRKAEGGDEGRNRLRTQGEVYDYADVSGNGEKAEFYYRDGKTAVQQRASQESRTDSNLTNAEI